MRGRWIHVAAGLLAVSSGADARPGSQAVEDRLTVPLSRVEIAPGALRPGYGLAGELPGAAWRGTVGRATFLFLDLNGSGALEAGEGDGVALAGHPFVTFLPDVLLLEPGQCTLTFEGRTLVLDLHDLRLDSALVSGASFLTELRLASGLPPVTLSPNACQAAAKHCDYLKLHRLNTGSGGGTERWREKQETAGFTLEGAQAGQESLIAFGERDFQSALWHWYGTAFQRTKLVDPRVEEVGVAHRHGVSMLYPIVVNTVEAPVVHPADGAVDVPCRFSARGERPNVMPGTDDARECGFPLVVRLPRSLFRAKLLSFSLAGDSGTAVAGRSWAPMRKAHDRWKNNLDCAVFIPERPLAPKTGYTARLKLSGVPEPYTFSFTTGELDHAPFATAARRFVPVHPLAKQATKIQLSRRRLAGAVLRPGYGMEGPIPDTAQAARIGRTTFLLFDLDGDGELRAGAADGLGIAGSPFVVHLPEVLLTERGQCVLALDKRSLRLRRQELDVDPGLVADAAYLTELRIRAGLPPVFLDPPACEDAGLHCDYLSLNGLTDGWGKVSPHDERPGAHGYTDEGALAALSSNIAFAEPDFRAALAYWFHTAFHVAPMMDPTLIQFGAAHKHGVSLLYFKDAAGDVAVPVPHPAHGATDVPLAFSAKGELPNPVPGTKNGSGCGFPITVRLPAGLRMSGLAEFALEDSQGAEVAGSASSPLSPAHPDWPGNSGCAFFIPAEPLAPGEEYTARFWLVDMPTAIQWSFTTAAR